MNWRLFDILISFSRSMAGGCRVVQGEETRPGRMARHAGDPAGAMAQSPPISDRLRRISIPIGSSSLAANECDARSRRRCQVKLRCHTRAGHANPQRGVHHDFRMRPARRAYPPPALRPRYRQRSTINSDGGQFRECHQVSVAERQPRRAIPSAASNRNGVASNATRPRTTVSGNRGFSAAPHPFADAES